MRRAAAAMAVAVAVASGATTAAIAVAVVVASGATAAASTGGTGSFTGSFFGGGSGSNGGTVFSVGISGGTVLSTISMPVRFSGDLVVAFRGDRASGCSSRGLCGYSGTIVWQPPASAELVINTFRIHQRRVYDVSVLTDPLAGGGAATAHVRGPSPSTVCADAAPAGGQLDAATHGRKIALSLKDAYAGLTQTRCAGPLGEDYASALVTRSLDVKRLVRGRTVIDLSSQGEFAAHGFAGMVRSRVALRVGRPSVSEPGHPRPPHGRTVRRRTVDVAYRVNVVGDVLERFRGATQACDLVGSCGLTGSVDLRVRELGARGDLYAQASVGRPYRDLLAALGLRRDGDPRGISASGIVELGNPAQARGGPGDCRDATRTQPGALYLTVRRGAPDADYYNTGSAFLTRCPGPFVHASELASGGATRGSLRGTTTMFTLERTMRFRDDGYSGQIVAHLRIKMTRIKITSKIVTYHVG